VVPVARDDVVVLAEEGDRASDDGLLADIQVQKPPNFTLLVGANAALLEMADACHFGVERHLLGLGEGRVGGVFSEF